MANKRLPTGKRVSIPKKPLVRPTRRAIMTPKPLVRAAPRPTSGLKPGAGANYIGGQRTTSDPLSPTFSDVGIFGGELKYGAAPQWDPKSGVSYDDWQKGLKAQGATTDQRTASTLKPVNAPLGAGAGAGGKPGYTGYGGSKLSDAFNANIDKKAALEAKINAPASDYNQIQDPYVKQAAIDRDLAEKENAKQELYAMEQTRLAGQQVEQGNVAARNAGASATAPVEPTGNTTTDFANTRLSSRLSGITDQRQAYITKRRGEGIPDAQIRQELQTLPAEQTGVSAPPQVTPPPAAPTNAPPATGAPEAAPSPMGGATGDITGTPKGGTKVSKEGQKTDEVVEDPDIALLDTLVGTAFAGHPMAQLIAMQMKREYKNEKTALANALVSRGDSIEQANQEDIATQAFIEKWADKATAASNQYTELIQKNAEATQKYMAEQKQRDVSQLEYQKQIETQKLEKQKTQDVLKSSISMALAGGSYSGAGQQAIAESERQWDIAIGNLGKEFAFKAADVGAFYSNKYVESQNQLRLDIHEASTALDARIESYATQGFASTQAKKRAITEANNDYRTQRDKILSNHSTKLNGWIKEIGDQINQKRDDERAQTKDNKDNAYQMFNFAFTNSADPKMREAAVRQMRAAGYDLPMDIDYSKLTPDQQIRMLDLAEKQKKAMSTLDPSDYEGDAKSVAMMAANVQLNLTDSDKAVFAQSQAPQIASLLRQGKIEEAKKIIYDAAVTNLSQTRKDVADRRAMVSYLDYAIGRLESASSLPGFYTGKWNDAQKYFGQQQDAQYRDIASVVSLASVESLHELYGSALTATEMETARTILPLKGSNMLDAIQQLKNFRAYQNNKQEQIVQGISGGGAFGPGSNGGTTSKNPTNEGMGNIMNGGEEITIETSMINNKPVTGRLSAIAALERANQAMIADGLEGIIVNSSFRDTAQQTAAYERYQRGEIALAAKPGTSLHEKGIAFDITNWKKAEKYLIAQGFNPLPADIRSSDPAHFSFLHIG